MFQELGGLLWCPILAMLEVRNLTKRYRGFTAVNDVSFSVRPGETLGYLGPNGAGKSTTVKILIGLLDPSEGQVLFNGRSVIDDMPSFQRLIGYVPEEPNLYPHLSGGEYLRLAGRLRGLHRTALERKIEQFLTLFSLWDDRDSLVTSYSKGMRQKILLSAALLHNPEILILDEPMSGLDVTASLIVRNLLQKLSAQGKIILFSSHVLEIVEKVCARVMILNKGKVVANDSVEQLRELMRLPSLEAIFAELTTEERQTADVADRIVTAMRT